MVIAICTGCFVRAFTALRNSWILHDAASLERERNAGGASQTEKTARSLKTDRAARSKSHSRVPVFQKDKESSRDPIQCHKAE